MRQNENIRKAAEAIFKKHFYDASQTCDNPFLSEKDPVKEAAINAMVEFAQEQSQQSEPQHDLKTEIVLKELTDFADYVSRQRTNGHVYFKNGFNLANSVFCGKLIEILKKHKAPTKKITS